MGESAYIGAYLKESVRKPEEMRTPEQKGSGDKKGANIYKAKAFQGAFWSMKDIRISQRRQ